VAFTWLWDHLTFQRGAQFKAAVWAVKAFTKHGCAGRLRLEASAKDSSRADRNVSSQFGR